MKVFGLTPWQMAIYLIEVLLSAAVIIAGVIYLCQLALWAGRSLWQKRDTIAIGTLLLAVVAAFVIALTFVVWAAFRYSPALGCGVGAVALIAGIFGKDLKRAALKITSR